MLLFDAEPETEMRLLTWLEQDGKTAAIAVEIIKEHISRPMKGLWAIMDCNLDTEEATVFDMGNDRHVGLALAYFSWHRDFTP